MSSSVIRMPARPAALSIRRPSRSGRRMGAVTVVVEVVELADDRVAGEHHLGERRRRQLLVRVGVERRGELVHLVAPRPERAAAPVRAPPQGAVEGVAVGVGEPGQRQPGEPRRACGWRRHVVATPVILPPSTSITTPSTARSAIHACSHQYVSLRHPGGERFPQARIAEATDLACGNLARVHELSRTRRGRRTR